MAVHPARKVKEGKWQKWITSIGAVIVKREWQHQDSFWVTAANTASFQKWPHLDRYGIIISSGENPSIPNANNCVLIEQFSGSFFDQCSHMHFFTSMTKKMIHPFIRSVTHFTLWRGWLMASMPHTHQSLKCVCLLQLCSLADWLSPPMIWLK